MCAGVLGPDVLGFVMGTPAGKSPLAAADNMVALPPAAPIDTSPLTISPLTIPVAPVPVAPEAVPVPAEPQLPPD